MRVLYAASPGWKRPERVALRVGAGGVAADSRNRSRRARAAAKLADTRDRRVDIGGAQVEEQPVPVRRRHGDRNPLQLHRRHAPYADSE
jgi:hypothetical protein